MKRLSKRDRIFCFELLADAEMNTARAAKKVGYSTSVANQKAYVWVSNSEKNPKPQVKAFLDQLLRKRERNLEIDAKRIDEELAKIAFSNITDIIETMKGHINLMLLKDLPEEQKHAIAEISESEHQGVVTRKIRMHNKIKALELLLRRIGKADGSREITVNIIKDGKIISTKQIGNGTDSKLRN